MPSLKALRDRWLGNARVRDRIACWPIGRRIADAHARRLFGIVGGFVESQMLAAAVDLGVLDALHDSPCEAARWPALAGLPPEGAAALLQALVAIGLVERRRGGRLGLTIDGLVVATDPGLRAMIAHDRLFYADLADPVAMLKGGGAGCIASFWPYAGKSGDAAGYAALMAVSQSFAVDGLFASVDFSGSRHVMDVGGGDGALLAALADRYPHPQLTLVDLPAVAVAARESIARAGLADRIAVVARDRGEPLPRGADTIMLVRVLHDQDDDAARALLAATADALKPGGRLIVAEPMARPGRDPQTAYFGAYFAAMRSGRLRTPTAIRAMLATAGLEPTRTVAHPSALLAVVTAAKQLTVTHT